MLGAYTQKYLIVWKETVNTRRLAAITVVCLVLFLTGMFLDWKGFIGNASAGAIEVIITVTVIDWLLQRQRRKRWQGVRAQILVALTQHIGNMASEYMSNIYGPGLHLLDFTEDIRAGYWEAKPQTVKAIQSMVKNMEEAPRPDDHTEQAESLHSVIQWDVTQVRDSLLPRVIDIECDEPELVSLLSALDNADRRWVNQMILDREVAAGNQYSAAIDLLREAARVYGYVVDHPSV
jgi:hypothetical protein